MSYVPGGEFFMGNTEAEVDEALQVCREYHEECLPEYFTSQLPMHLVTVDSIWLDQHEVTNGQYQQCVGAGICEPPDESVMPHDIYYSDRTYTDYPVVWVDWYQASGYCEWAGGRLPTEAEWEYAARGPEQLAYPWGDEFDGELLNYADVSCTFDFVSHTDDAYNDGNPFISPKGSYPDGASWCEALDMAGNVWEWTADWFGDYPSEPQDNPQGPFYGEGRVLRGGCWACDRGSATTTNRNWQDPSIFGINIGFRCVISVPDSA
jgi:serine/threonine-protein kinase